MLGEHGGSEEVNGEPLLSVLVLAGRTGSPCQASLIAHQTIVYSLDPAARSRLNAIFFTVVFVGMVNGSALGGLLLEHAGVSGVFGLATVAAASALALVSVGRESRRAVQRDNVKYGR